MGLTYALNDNLADVLKAVEGVSPDVVDQLIHVIVVEWLYDNFDLTDEQEETLDHVMGLFR